MYPRGKGIATSGSYLRGTHIYNPHTVEKPNTFLSLTVIGPNVYEADRFATAAFAMGRGGVQFIAELEGRGMGEFEAYAIDEKGMALYTPGFEAYTHA
jgi:thiamine biosynthesis lipoprotein